MNNDHLVRMCNQIGTFFESMPDREKATEDLAKHLKNFWAPSMRQQILSQVEQGEVTELSEIALQALQQHKSILL
jgi:formate dehydrogenase subunit delta